MSVAIGIDIALSFGFSLLSSFLKPRKVDNSPDNLPTVNFGESLYRSWGTTQIPGTLMFAGEPSLNNPIPIDGKNNSTPEELASYACFLNTNPINPTLVAVSINGLVVGTTNSAIPLTKEIKTDPVTDIPTGLKKYQQVTFRFYDGLQTTPDPMIQKNGFPWLIYQGQTYIVVADSLRSVFGGRGANLSAVITNDTTGTIAPSAVFKGTSDTWATLEFYETSSSFAGIFINANKMKRTAPRGYQFAYSCAKFEGVGSTLPNNAGASLIIFGTESEFRLTDNISTITSGLTVSEAGYATTPPGIAGKFTRLLYPTVGAFPTINTATVIVGKIDAELREVNLGSLQPSPFYNIGTTIYNGLDVAVGTCQAGESVFGWNGAIYTRNLITNNTTPFNDPPLSVTTLNKVITGLMDGTDLPFVFANNFTTNIIGFSTNRKERSTDIANLLAITNRIVYQRRDGTLVFSGYPTVPASPVTVTRDDHVEQPEIKIEPYETFPDALDFSYKDLDRGFDTSVVRVGGDTGRIDTFSIDVVCTRSQALVFANNLFNRQKRQILSGTLTLAPEFNVIEPGDVVLLEKMNPSGEDLYVIILRVETGANLIVKAEFINYAPINDTPTVVPNGAGVGGSPSGSTNKNVYVIDTEPRSSRVGLGYFTTSNSSIRRGADVSNAISGGLIGSVSGITTTTATVSTNIAPLVGNDYYLLNTATGDGSWITPSVVTAIGAGVYNMTIAQGRYSSNTFTSPTALLMLQIQEESVINDGYNTLNMIQDSTTYTHSFNTRKRLVEPRPAGFFRSATGIKFYRRALFQGDDLDLSLGTFNLAYWRVANATSVQSMIVGSSNGVIVADPFTVLPGHTVTVTQVNSTGSPITGAYTTTYVI